MHIIIKIYNLIGNNIQVAEKQPLNIMKFDISNH
jgi:hypothetical protein